MGEAFIKMKRKVSEMCRASVDGSFLRSLLPRHDVMAFTIVAAIGVYHFLFGVDDLGLFLLFLGCFQLLFPTYIFPRLGRISVSQPVSVSVWGGRQNFDLTVGMAFALACGVLSLAGSLFFIAKGQIPPYYGISGLEVQWSGLMMGLIAGPLAVLAYGLMYLGRYFLFSLVSLIVATFTTFYVIGYLGGLVGVSATIFAILSKDEFVS